MTSEDLGFARRTLNALGPARAYFVTGSYGPASPFYLPPCTLKQSQILITTLSSVVSVRLQKRIGSAHVYLNVKSIEVTAVQLLSAYPASL